MKKNVVLLLVGLLLLMLPGCSEKEKTDEELSALDVRDIDSMYAELKDTTFKNYTREDIDLWEPSYFDITGDGSEDVVFVAPYGEGALEEILFIHGDEGVYELIPSDIELLKYQNRVELRDGLIAVTRTGGGSSIRVTNMGIYDYDGQKIVDTETNIVMEDIVSLPDGYEMIGEIDGPLTDFKHTLTHRDLATDALFVVEKTRYTYDADAFHFNQIDKEMVLSASMTRKDILDVFGDDFDEEENINQMDDSTETTMIYPGIEFSFSHYSEEVPLKAKPTSITVTSDEYSYQCDVRIGEPALDAIARCEKEFDNVINRHAQPEEELPDWFIYQEKNAEGQTVDDGYILTFGYNTEERYLQKEEITKDVIVTSLKLISQYD